VEVNRDGDRFRASVDGRKHEVDVKVINGGWSLLVGPPEGDPYDSSRVGAGFSRPTRSYEVAFSTSAERATIVHVDGMPVEVSVSTGNRVGATAASHDSAGGPQRITAPMPGKIVKLLVKPGDNVQPRQGLVVVEAMKMENELRARAAGTVSEVRVTEGSSVEAGAILVILE
jgi:biotin carboxyl carrier protein